jgi:hypothetical protein
MSPLVLVTAVLGIFLDMGDRVADFDSAGESRHGR